METFDRSKLNFQDYQDLNAAVSRAAPKVGAWYLIKNVFLGLFPRELPLRDATNLTEPVSDYGKHHKELDSLIKDEYNARIAFQRMNLARKTNWIGKLAGNRDVEICFYNPRIIVPELSFFCGTANLVEITGWGWGNTYDASVNFEYGTSFLNEEDQDIAHRLGFMYTPTGILECNSLKASDFELHKEKLKVDESGNEILYCDNLCCQKRVRNPILVIDKKTGGLYHSKTCFEKDMRIKAYLYLEKGNHDFNPFPSRISLENALDMYKMGELQQSLNPKTKEAFSSTLPWQMAGVFSLD